MESSEEEIWRTRRERINKAYDARTGIEQDPAESYLAARELEDFMHMEEDNVDMFISRIETLAHETNLRHILNLLELTYGSLLHIAVLRNLDDTARLLVDHCPDHLIAAKNDWGETPLHAAVKHRKSGAKMLIRRAGDLAIVKDEDQILRMKNNYGNTPFHEAVLNQDVEMVHLLLSEDPELVYLCNEEKKSPLYLALDIDDNDIHEALFTPQLEPSKIEGLAPVHGAVVRGKCGLLAQILNWNKKLFAMTDSKGGNLFHFAAHMNQVGVFDLLGYETDYLAQKRDMNGDLPIHVASKMGHVHIIQKLDPVSNLLNGQGQTVLHVAAKYGQTSAVKYMLSTTFRYLINDKDHNGNTALHLATMYSQPAVLMALVLDTTVDTSLVNHECLTAGNITRANVARGIRKGECTLRELLAAMVLSPASTVKTDLLVRKPEVRDKEFKIVWSQNDIPTTNKLKDVINTHMVVAALVTTVTFAAGFAVPGGFNSSDSKHDQGMATMLDKRMFQAFVICNTIAMFASMFLLTNLMFAQGADNLMMTFAFRRSLVQLSITLPAMCAAFITGGTLTVGNLPWLANTIFYVGLLCLVLISGVALLQYPVYFLVHHRIIRSLFRWVAFGFLKLWNFETFILEDNSEEDETARRASGGRPSDNVGESELDESEMTKRGDSPHPPNH